jgi:glycosyltransferase involved in cell wall biosynthesis
MQRILWEQLAQPGTARRLHLDVLHAPVNVGPLLRTCPTVVTIHDLSFILYPELFRPFNRVYQQRFARWTVDHAAAIIAVSSSTRDDLVRLMGVPPGRVAVVPNGVGEEMQPLDPALVAAHRARHGLPDRLILFVGTLEPRKNVLTLLEAFACLCGRPGFSHHLAIVGGKGWYYGEIDGAVERLGLRERVIFAGFVPQEELPLWYNTADLFVYPSLYEGFGLPPLEAMACGTPVVVSNVSALPEVVGEAGLRVPPLDAEALAAAIEAVLGAPEQHSALRAAGLQRAATFSWRETARRTSQVYHQVVGDGWQ